MTSLVDSNQESDIDLLMSKLHDTSSDDASIDLFGMFDDSNIFLLFVGHICQLAPPDAYGTDLL